MVAVDEKGFIPAEHVQEEVEWFYDRLGIDDMYFATESVEASVSTNCVVDFNTNVELVS